MSEQIEKKRARLARRGIAHPTMTTHEFKPRSTVAVPAPVRSIDLYEPRFSQDELSEVTGLSMGTINNWIQSGAIKPAAINTSLQRKPRIFSPIAMYEAMVTGSLVEQLDAKPETCAAIAQATTKNNQWISEVAERESTHSIGKRIIANEYYQVVSWSGRHWDVQPMPKSTSKEMLDGELKLLLPVSRYLGSVIKGCQALIGARPRKY
jgi:hypothetical protein